MIIEETEFYFQLEHIKINYALFKNKFVLQQKRNKHIKYHNNFKKKIRVTKLEIIK